MNNDENENLDIKIYIIQQRYNLSCIVKQLLYNKMLPKYLENNKIE